MTAFNNIRMPNEYSVRIVALSIRISTLKMIYRCGHTRKYCIQYLHKIVQILHENNFRPIRRQRNAIIAYKYCSCDRTLNLNQARNSQYCLFCIRAQKATLYRRKGSRHGIILRCFALAFTKISGIPENSMGIYY